MHVICLWSSRRPVIDYFHSINTSVFRVWLCNGCIFLLVNGRMKLNRKTEFLYILNLASSLLLSSRCQEKQKYFRNISKADWPFEKHSQAFWLKIPPTIKVMKALRSLKNAYTELNLSWRRSLSSRNQSTNLLRKLIDWFLYDRDLRHERVE